MRKTLEMLIGGAALSSALGASAAYAQASVTGTGTGTINVVQPIAIATGTNLAFGRVGRPSTAGTVIIPAQATVTTATYSGGVGKAGVQTLSAASFTVTGDGGSGFSITPDASFSMTSGANSIVVTPSANVASGSLSGATGSSGSLIFYVGGTASLASNQTVAAYTGTFHVVVAYN